MFCWVSNSLTVPEGYSFMCGNEKLLMCVYVNKDTVYVENGYYTFFKLGGQISAKSMLLVLLLDRVILR